MRNLAEVALFSSRVKDLKQFYASILGVKPSWEDSNAAEFVLGKVKVFLHAQLDAIPDGPPNQDHIAFEVDDVDSACEKLKSLGIRVEVEPRDFYWARSAYFRDPDGRLVELQQPKTKPVG